MAVHKSRTCWWLAACILLCCQHLAVAQNRPVQSAEDIMPLVNQYCGACHAVPPPWLLPKRSWPAVVDSMVRVAENQTGQPFIPADAVKHIKALYYGSSPEALPLLPYIDRPHPGLQFSVEPLDKGSAIPQILNIQQVDLGGKADHSFLVSDGEKSQLILLEAFNKDGLHWRETVLAEVAIPIKAQVVDYNGDGRLDILVSDLGEFPPNNKLAGKVYILQQQADGRYSQRLLMERLGRITDVQALDMDGDGDLDLAVSAFGGGNVGEVFWMENQRGGQYKKHSLLGLSGALNITPVDLNGDGKMDLVSLVAQEHEAVIAFINEGDGKFTRRDIIEAGHPMFGATSMVVHDLNQNGRPDIIFTNGDAFDTQTEPKPYHGVQWLENRGDLQFIAHDIGRFYGAANVAVGDINGNGHLDLVVSSWHNHWDDEKRQSLIWFENNGKQQFAPRPITGGYTGLVPIELVDIDGNGRLDILTGAFRMDILKEFLETHNEQVSMDTKAIKADQRAPSARLLLLFNQAVQNTPATAP